MPIDLEPDPYLLAVNDPTKLYLAHLGTMFLIVCIYIYRIIYIYIYGICMVYIYIYGMEQKLSPINAIQMDNGLLIPTIPGIITVDPHAYIPCILTIAHIKLILKSHNSTLCHHVPVTLSHEKLVFFWRLKEVTDITYTVYIYIYIPMT